MNKLIKDTLNPLNIPVHFQTYSGTENIYITYFEYLGQGEQYSDDDESLTGHYIQVDIWSKGNYKSIVKQTKNLMKQAGFRRKTEHETYEPDTKIYHKTIRFFYAKKQGVID